ncbi:uncharacterized protein EAE97_010404 [Botrytis byssoidea]|uniref:RRM domain-containing protein n=1 Tax=Botrytis byssoidea TaxID=139641 RepID=A0A9P5I3C0_9HELO|nr:uncharacterized protein EAE97_010404 [Botrytis byssoidea]KAF7926104.1 hypothetical protein EAE97_010404 [Botrytis byssoidea]
MSSFKFTSTFPRSQNGQNGSFWNPTSPLAAPHNRRQSEYLSRTMANALGTVPLPNFNFDERKPRRITSPLSDVKPIGHERIISRQMGYSQFSISEVGENLPSFKEEEESCDNSPIVTQSLVRGIYPMQHGASSRQDDEVSDLNLETSIAGLNIDESPSPSKGKKSYGTLQRYVPYAHARDHTAKTSMHPSSVAIGHRDVTAIFRGPQVQSSLPVSGVAPYAPPNNIQLLGHRAVGYEHNRVMTSYGGPEQYMSQFNAQVVGAPSETDDDYNIESRRPQLGLEQQEGNRFSGVPSDHFRNAYPGGSPTQARSMASRPIAALTFDQTSTDRSGTSSLQPRLPPTGQLFRVQGLLAKLPINASTAAQYSIDNEDREFASGFGGEANLPNELNCAVWIKGIAKEFARQFLYQELFNAVSTGPIVAAYIHLGGDQHPSHAAKVVFKHPEHAARLVQRASYQGIYINGHRIRVEPNRNGHREFPFRFHYRSRVVLIEVFNNPSMDLPFWKMFISNLCVLDIESCRHLAYSTPKHMVMEFRFARIFGQAAVLLAGIRSTASFEGMVTASYVPDVPCDICDVN